MKEWTMTNKPTLSAVRTALGTLMEYFSEGGSADALTTAATPPSQKAVMIFPYKTGSKSAKALNEALGGGNLLKRENSDFNGKEGQFVLNWGSGTGYFNAKIGKAKVLNPPKLVDIAINKLAFFNHMLGDDAPRTAWWTINEQQARAWLATGYTVIARDDLEGSKGAGIRVMKSGLDFRPAKLYTMFVASTHEYRTYVFNGKVVDAREKRLKSGMAADPNNMRYDEDKYLFCEHALNSQTTRVWPSLVPAEVITQSEKTAKKLGLLTGGIDVIYNVPTNQAFVLEYNTAPYLGDHTAAVLAAKLKEYVAQA